MKSTAPIFLLILSIGLFYSFTSPTYRDAKVKAVEAADYKSVLANINQIIETRDKLLVNYNSISKTELERLAKILPQNVDTVRLALDLDNIAAKYGISIKQVSIDNRQSQTASTVALPGTGEPYEKVLVSVSFISNYKNFKSFMQDLEKSVRIMDVKTASFTVGETGFYEHKITLETYWVK